MNSNKNNNGILKTFIAGGIMLTATLVGAGLAPDDIQ